MDNSLFSDHSRGNCFTFRWCTGAWGLQSVNDSAPHPRFREGAAEYRAARPWMRSERKFHSEIIDI